MSTTQEVIAVNDSDEEGVAPTPVASRPKLSEGKE